VEENTTKQPGLEITVRTDNGQTFAVTQADDGERFNIGDRVRILESGGQARVTH
jgi:outer membrane lipoprotein SlyB